MLRPTGGVFSARRAPPLGTLSRCADGDHRGRHLRELLANHRALSIRRGRLPRGVSPARSAHRFGIGLRSARRLRPHGLDLDCQRFRCAVQLPTGPLAARKGVGLGAGDQHAGRSQSAGNARGGPDPRTDLPRFRDHACAGDRLRARGECRSAAGDRGQRRRWDPTIRIGDRRLRHAGDFAPRLQPRRRNLHGHRSRQQRPANPASAQSRDRQTDDALHVGVARVYRIGPPASPI